MTLNIVLMILGLVLLADSLIVLFFPNWAIRTMRKWIKSVKTLRRVGFWELLIALILFLIGMNI